MPVEQNTIDDDGSNPNPSEDEGSYVGENSLPNEDEDGSSVDENVMPSDDEYESSSIQSTTFSKSATPKAPFKLSKADETIGKSATPKAPFKLQKSQLGNRHRKLKS